MRATFQSYSSLPNPDHSREATPKPPSTPDPKQSKSASSAPPNHLIYDSSDGINGVQHPTSEYLSLNLRGPMFSCFDISCASIFFTIFTSFRTPPPFSYLEHSQLSFRCLCPPSFRHLQRLFGGLGRSLNPFNCQTRPFQPARGRACVFSAFFSAVLPGSHPFGWYILL